MRLHFVAYREPLSREQCYAVVGTSIRPRSEHSEHSLDSRDSRSMAVRARRKSQDGRDRDSLGTRQTEFRDDGIRCLMARSQ